MTSTESAPDIAVKLVKETGSADVMYGFQPQVIALLDPPLRKSVHERPS